MNRAQLKAQAKEQIKGKIGILFVIGLIVAAISIVASLVFSLIPAIGNLLVSLVITPAFTLSMIRVYLNLTRGVTPKADDAFTGFDDFWSAFKVNFLVGLYTFLWSLLFVIPGIIKGYSYSFALYILAENKGKSARECIKESMAMTDGHKMELFVLGLSFIGWILLGYVTFGISYIWTFPYIEATFANAYNSLKPDNSNVLLDDTAAEAEEVQE